MDVSILRSDIIQIFFKISPIFRQVFWVMTACNLVGGYFGGTYCLLLQGQSDPKNGGSLFP